MATTLTQLRPLSISTPPPADNDTSIPRRDSTSNRRSFINTSPEQRLVRRSSNRSSWSSASNTSPTDVPSPLSDTTSAGPRKFRLPVRVSTQPSFGTSDSSPQARRRSLSLSSDPKTDNKASDSKRRTRNLYLSQLDEDKAEELRKSPRPSPRVASPPPPPYEKVPASSTETSKVSDKPKDITPKPAAPADAPKPAPVAAAPPPRSPAQTPKSPRKQPPAPATTTPAPRTTITPAPQKMSSSSSP